MMRKNTKTTRSRDWVSDFISETFLLFLFFTGSFFQAQIFVGDSVNIHVDNPKNIHGEIIVLKGQKAIIYIAKGTIVHNLIENSTFQNDNIAKSDARFVKKDKLPVIAKKTEKKGKNSVRKIVSKNIFIESFQKDYHDSYSANQHYIFVGVANNPNTTISKFNIAAINVTDILFLYRSSINPSIPSEQAILFSDSYLYCFSARPPPFLFC